MSDGPPAWMDDGPPADAGGHVAPGGNAGNRQRGGYNNNAPPKMTADQVAAAANDFYAWLTSRDTLEQLKMLLPAHVDAKVFIATAKTAAMTKPDLLREDYRASLLAATIKAAGMGLLPDGKQGAFVPRWDTDARKMQIVWQPMVHGIIKLGRETGGIRHIRAVIVFRGEPFRIIQGDEDRIEHEVDLDIVDAAYAALSGGKDNRGNAIARPADFMAHVYASYCVITGADGTVTKRWMTRQRIVSLWESSRATNGPWNSRWIDEMIIKGIILFTAKHINLDTESEPAKKFQAALMTDMDIDFDRRREIEEEERPAPRALSAPGGKLDAMEGIFTRGREAVPVGGQDEPERQREATQQDAGPQDRKTGPDVQERRESAGGAGAPSQERADGGSAPHSSAPGGSDPRNDQSPPPPTPEETARAALVDRTDKLLDEIANRTWGQIKKLVDGDKYVQFLVDLRAARLGTEADRLTLAVAMKLDGGPLLEDIAEIESVTELGDWQKRKAEEIDRQIPAVRAAVRKALTDRFLVLGGG